MVDNSVFLHGRVDPGLDENIVLVEAVPVRAPEKRDPQYQIEQAASASVGSDEAEDANFKQQSTSSQGTSAIPTKALLSIHYARTTHGQYAPVCIINPSQSLHAPKL